MRYVVDGHEFPNTESNLDGDGQYPPFRIFDIEAQDYLPGVHRTREAAEKRLAKIIQADDHPPRWRNPTE